jgi:hypothetical protein
MFKTVIGPGSGGSAIEAGDRAGHLSTSLTSTVTTARSCRWGSSRSGAGTATRSRPAKVSSGCGSSI